MVWNAKLQRTLFWEFIAMTLFVYIGPGTAIATGATFYTGISLSFGFAITALVYMTAHTSGGHVNCAVTFALCVAGLCDPMDSKCKDFDLSKKVYQANQIISQN